MLLPPLLIRSLSGRNVTIEDISLSSFSVNNQAQLELLCRRIESVAQIGMRHIDVPLVTKRTAFNWQQWEERPENLSISVSIDSLREVDDAIASKPDTVILRVSATEPCSRRRHGKSRVESLEEMTEAMQRILPHAKTMVAVDSSFSADSERDSEEAIDIGDLFASAGVSGIILCDTAGLAGPLVIERYCDGLPERWAGLALGLELSDAHGMASANTIAALATGISRFRTFWHSADDAQGMPVLVLQDTERLARLLAAMDCHTDIDLARNASPVD